MKLYISKHLYAIDSTTISVNTDYDRHATTAQYLNMGYFVGHRDSNNELRWALPTEAKLKQQRRAR